VVQTISVSYTADQAVRDAESLCRLVQNELENHLQLARGIGLSEWHVMIEIATFKLKGTVKFHVTGFIDRTQLDEVVLHVVNRPKWNSKKTGGSRESRLKHEQQNGIVLLAAWCVWEFFCSAGRFIWRSAATRAIGRSWYTSRVLQALDECIADTRELIDRTVQQRHEPSDT
jgi:hypothetical protein